MNRLRINMSRWGVSAPHPGLGSPQGQDTDATGSSLTHRASQAPGGTPSPKSAACVQNPALLPVGSIPQVIRSKSLQRGVAATDTHTLSQSRGRGRSAPGSRTGKRGVGGKHLARRSPALDLEVVQGIFLKDGDACGQGQPGSRLSGSPPLSCPGWKRCCDAHLTDAETEALNNRIP